MSTHECEFPGCYAQVPVAAWGCSRHLLDLPKHMRRRLEAAYAAKEHPATPPERPQVEAFDEYADAMEALRSWLRTGQK
jgi:hypothetical protein